MPRDADRGHRGVVLGIGAEAGAHRNSAGCALQHWARGHDDILTNPFRYGDLALDDAFTDRAEYSPRWKADILNGQNVVITSRPPLQQVLSIWRVVQELIPARTTVLVAPVDLMKTATKEKLAEKLASSIYDDIASTVVQGARKKQQDSVHRGLRVRAGHDGARPPMARSASAFQAGPPSPRDIDATIERLLELPAQLGADRKRRVALVFDEFQEIVKLDRGLLPVMRSLFQEQPDVAHVYLGSKRHMMEQIFNDAHEPFWRSAKQIELGVIPPQLFADFTSAPASSKPAGSIDETVMTSISPTPTLRRTEARPTPSGRSRTCGTTRHPRNRRRPPRPQIRNRPLPPHLEGAPSSLVLEALAKDPGQPPLNIAYRREHNLPGTSTIQRALEAIARRRTQSNATRRLRIARTLPCRMDPRQRSPARSGSSPAPPTRRSRSSPRR